MTTAPTFATPQITVDRRPDGRILLSSEQALTDHEPTITRALRIGARRHPDRPLAAERDGDGWSTVSWAEAGRRADGIAQALLDRGLDEDRPLMVLSGNSVAHLLLTLGANTAGVPMIPVSPAYSLSSRGYDRLLSLVELSTPALVVADDGESFRGAVEAIAAAGVDAEAVTGRPAVEQLGDARPTADVEAAVAGQGPDTVAKILFTSGSTGRPKGVITTHGMMCSNQQAAAQVFPFLRAESPVLVDWLPWSHTFGGSFNVNQVLTGGGTLYIDDGRPTPQDFSRTVDALRSIQPTVYYNVPAAYALLAAELERDREFAAHFLARVRFLFSGGASLPTAISERLTAIISEVSDREIPVISGWGATETAPLATAAHYHRAPYGCIGVPIPGTTVALVPDGDKFEIRVKGPNVTPGYLRNAEATARAFDEDGFYRTGDAVRLVPDPGGRPDLMFEGRLAEDFKLVTGTMVAAGDLRPALLSGLGVLKDAVIAGRDREFVAALAWLDEAAAAEILGEPPSPALLESPRLREILAGRLAGFNRGSGSSARVERLLLLAEPASIDAGEITDKGYVNQRQVLERRSDLVEALFAEPPDPSVVVAAPASRSFQAA